MMESNLPHRYFVLSSVFANNLNFNSFMPVLALLNFATHAFFFTLHHYNYLTGLEGIWIQDPWGVD